MDTENLSTTIDTEPGPSAAGGGQPKIAEPTTIPTTRDDLEAAFKADDEAKAEPKDDAKAEPDAKDEGGEKEPKDAKPEKQGKAPEPDKAKQDDKGAEERPEKQPEQKADEAKDGTKRHPDAPAKFLPRAKELWRNVPNEVKAEVDRVLREHDDEVGQYKQSTERYEQLREFDELAKSNGRDLRESLNKMGQIEEAMARNPIAGLNMILMEVGPRKADGQPISIMEVAQFLSQQGAQGYQQIMSRAQQQPQQQQGNQEVEQLRSEIAQMKADAAAREIIEPFAAKNPRYRELEPDIAFFLQSGKIPASLSPSDRLAAAYDMAVRINPSSTVPPTTDEPATDRRADNDFGGSAKSIKSSPGSVSEELDAEAPANESIADSIRKTMRRMPA